MNIPQRDAWLDYIRAKELETVFANLGEGINGRALELGCGGGAQSQILHKKFKIFISSDLCDQRRYLNKKINFVICDAQKLPFKNTVFDFVFSSNMLEHIESKELCLSELKRVLKKEGLIVHTVPTFTWKFISLFLHYPGMLKLILDKMLNLIDYSSKACRVKTNKAKAVSHYLRVILYPMVHGAYKNNTDELLQYRKNTWAALFQKNGYIVRDIINLYFYSPYMFFKFRFIKLRKFVGKSCFSSCRAFVLGINNE